MPIFNPFRSQPKPKRILTSRPIFQFSSSFINDDDDGDSLKKPYQPLPLFHQRPLPQHTHSSSTLSKSSEKARKPHPKPRARIHLILHILNTVFTLTSLTLYITAIPIWNANFHHTQSPIPTDYTDGLVLGPLLISLLASTFLLLTEHTRLQHHLTFRLRLRLDSTSPPPKKRSSRNALAPKRLILLTLTILLTLFPTLTLSATNSLALSFRAPIHNSAGLVICNLANVLSRPCQPILYRIGELQIGAIVAGGLAWCVWLVVLGVSVREWARERRERERKRKERRERRRKERNARPYGLDRTGGYDKGYGDVFGTETKAEKNWEYGAGLSGFGKAGHEDRSRNVRTGQHAYGPHNLAHTHTTTDNLGGSTVRKPPRVITPAARLTTQKVKPRETIQAWLNDRYA